MARKKVRNWTSELGRKAALNRGLVATPHRWIDLTCCSNRSETCQRDAKRCRRFETRHDHHLAGDVAWIMLVALR
jgi:hypothetical protein